MANHSPNTSGLRPFAKGRSGNPGGRPKKPDVEALNRFIEHGKLEEAIARVWTTHALGLESGEPNVALLRMLIEYRNGQPPKGEDKDDDGEELDELLRDDDPKAGPSPPPEEVPGRPDPVQ